LNIFDKSIEDGAKYLLDSFEERLAQELLLHLYNKEVLLVEGAGFFRNWENVFGKLDLGFSIYGSPEKC